MPGTKALVVTSNGQSMKVNGYLERTLGELAQAGVEAVVFDQVEANPLRSTVMAGATFARRNSCDFLVALGGGSVMNASKGIAAMATNRGDIWDYIAGGSGGGKALETDPLPLICITTTAGTGSEAINGRYYETNEKIGFGGDDRLFPTLSIVDPELMVTVPSNYTAYQGFDVLLQGIEVYISKFANAMSDMLALTVIENVTK